MGDYDIDTTAYTGATGTTYTYTDDGRIYENGIEITSIFGSNDEPKKLPKKSLGSGNAFEQLLTEVKEQ